MRTPVTHHSTSARRSPPRRRRGRSRRVAGDALGAMTRASDIVPAQRFTELWLIEQRRVVDRFDAARVDAALLNKAVRGAERGRRGEDDDIRRRRRVHGERGFWRRGARTSRSVHRVDVGARGRAGRVVPTKARLIARRPPKRTRFPKICTPLRKSPRAAARSSRVEARGRRRQPSARARVSDRRPRASRPPRWAAACAGRATPRGPLDAGVGKVGEGSRDAHEARRDGRVVDDVARGRRRSTRRLRIIVAVESDVVECGAPRGTARAESTVVEDMRGTGEDEAGRGGIPSMVGVEGRGSRGGRHLRRVSSLSRRRSKMSRAPGPLPSLRAPRRRPPAAVGRRSGRRRPLVLVRARSGGAPPLGGPTTRARRSCAREYVAFHACVGRARAPPCSRGFLRSRRPAAAQARAGARSCAASSQQRLDGSSTAPAGRHLDAVEATSPTKSKTRLASGARHAEPP